ncbi:MAG TPA: YicC/YloC family endoribonuclease [Planctomycetota bacterium]|nr:YicC/YloC family endoribonuclease [Planctomycetota bacterium]
MLKSMTGYGEATRETGRFAISIEVRSVNNRFLKLSTKIPEELSYIQNLLEEIARQKVSRGSVTIVLRYQSTDESALHDIDGRVLEKYWRQLKTLRDELGSNEEIRLRDLLLLPGVVQSRDVLVPEKDEVSAVAREVLEAAIDAMVEMRKREGAHLESELRQMLERVESHLETIRTEAPRAVEEQQTKLKQRVRQLLGEHHGALAEDAILKEVAILADRADISEEIARLDSHVKQLDETLRSNGSVGRRLEFIVQEMFRESNTIGSKSVSSRLSESVLHLKAEVERIKEQVANIE